MASHGAGKKGDGTLMGSGSDWFNPRSNTTKTRQMALANTSKERKFENLSSDLFADPSQREERGKPNLEAGKLSEVKEKVVNKGFKVDTYKKVQAQLSSTMQESASIHLEHQPLSKKRVDLNNMADKQRQSDHLYSDLFGQGKKGVQKSPRKKAAADLGTDPAPRVAKDFSNYGAKTQKFD